MRSDSSSLLSCWRYVPLTPKCSAQLESGDGAVERTQRSSLEEQYGCDLRTRSTFPGASPTVPTGEERSPVASRA